MAQYIYTDRMQSNEEYGITRVCLDSQEHPKTQEMSQNNRIVNQGTLFCD